MVQIGSGHFHVIGKLEAALKIAGRNALVQIFRLFILLFSLLAGDREGVALHFKIDVGGAEARDGNGNTVLIIANALNIVGPLGRGLKIGGIIKHPGEVLKTDAGAIKRSKIKHVTFS